MTARSSPRNHQRWLMELTGVPTAAGREQRVVDWVERWVADRRHLIMRADRAGNLVLTAATGGRRRSSRPARRPRPIFITAHLDHPAFVVSRRADPRTIELDFRGGVHDPYFLGKAIEIFDADDHRHVARITGLDSGSKPFKRVTARLARPGATIEAGDVGRWSFAGADARPHVRGGLLRAPACDDLAGVVAALAALDALQSVRGMDHVGVLLTRAEEIGFIGAIAACRLQTMPRAARLLCLENSRSFPESPIGAGPILRVGDRLTIFSPSLTNRLGAILTRHGQAHPDFRWQRKLMPGGACEASVFAEHGYESTCLCLPLGNYHNMVDIDAVLQERQRARIAPEYISVSDFHGLVGMLVVCCVHLDSADVPPIADRFDQLFRTHRSIVGLDEVGA